MATIYIAGPMRGIENRNFPAFDKAEQWFIDKGWNVISPATMDRTNGETETSNFEPPKVYAARDTKAIVDKCQAIAFLKGWEHSLGAAAEFFLSRWLNLDMYLEDWIGYSFYQIDPALLLYDFIKKNRQ